LEACNSGIGRWGRATEEGKIKRTGVRELADWSAIEKPLSAHWFLEALRLALDDVQSRPAGAPQLFSNNFSAPSDGARGLRFEALRILFDLVRMTVILCDRCVAALAWDVRDEDR
jgi:hypothetical protein